VGNIATALDSYQRRNPRTSIPLAVVYKFFDDQGNYLAATITYYAFIAIFPLLLLSSSILGFVLQGDPELQTKILNSALGQFPIIGDQLGRPEGLRGSTSGVVVGSLVALYGALGLGQATQNAMHVAWSVPRNSRPNPFLQRLKSLLLLMTAGISVLVVTVVSAVGSSAQVFGARIDAGLRWGITGLTVLVVGSVFAVLFRVAAVSGSDNPHLGGGVKVAPGAFAVAIMWQALQYIGTVYAKQVLIDTSAMNQTFGLVLGLIGIIYLASVMAVLGMQINVVLARQLYPRALLTPFTDAVDLTDADRRAYELYARAQRHKGFEIVEVTFAERQRKVEYAPWVGDHLLTWSPYWVSVVLDMPSASFELGVDFWGAVTEYEVAHRRGHSGDIASLTPRHGDEFLRFRSGAEESPQICLFFHVADPRSAADRAESLGAVALGPTEGSAAVRDDAVVLRSPGGFLFGFVDQAGTLRPKPLQFIDGHHSLVDQVCLDIPRRQYSTECGFWAALTGWELRVRPVAAEFSHLVRPPEMPLRLLLQQLDQDEGSVAAHLDIATSDRVAEAERHMALGAVISRVHSRWTVLAGPEGSTYCLTDRDPDTGMLS
jgi:membrane protein